jgi:DNA-directed RNA polymerase subunit RPC12/RpoP
MKYYCKNCNSEFMPGNDTLRMPPVNTPVVHCPFCGKKDCEFGIIRDGELPMMSKEAMASLVMTTGPGLLRRPR